MKELTINYSNENIKLTPEWKPAQKFCSKGKVVDIKGKLSFDNEGKRFVLIEKKERQFTPLKLFGRRLLATSLTVVTLGAALFSPRVLSLFSRTKETIRIAIEASEQEVKKSQSQVSKLMLFESDLGGLSNAFRAAIHNRNQQNIRQCQSSDFKIQQLYFLLNTPLEQDQLLMDILDNSFPDRAITGLLNALYDYKKTLPKKHRADFKRMIEKFRQANTIACMISTIIYSPSCIRKEQFRQELIHYLKLRVSLMEEGEDLLIPTGYFLGNIYDSESLCLKTSHGHSIFMSLKRENHNFQVKIFNTGYGSEMHSTPNFNFLAPHLYDLGHFKEAQQTLFFEKLTSLINKPKISEGNSLHSVNEEFYAIFQNYNKLPVQSAAYKRQKVGNCAYQSMEAYLTGQFPCMDKSNSVLSFRQFQINSLKNLQREVSKYIRYNKNYYRYEHPLYKIEKHSQSFLKKIKIKVLFLFLRGLNIKIYKGKVRFYLAKEMLQTLETEASKHIHMLNWLQERAIPTLL